MARWTKCAKGKSREAEDRQTRGRREERKEYKVENRE